MKPNRLIGYSPVLLGGDTGGEVSGVDQNGDYTMGDAPSAADYMTNMIKVQKLLADRFELEAGKNDATAQLHEVPDGQQL